MSELLKCHTKFIVQIMLLISILLVIRGHNFPGGGFIGGLVASSAVALYILAYGVVPKKFDLYSPYLLAFGIVLLLLAFTMGLFLKQAPLQGVWFSFITMKIGSPIIFDFGIYFIVFGSTSWLLAELEDEKDA